MNVRLFRGKFIISTYTINQEKMKVKKPKKMG